MDCDYHLDRPVECAKPNIKTLDRVCILILPCEGRLPLWFEHLEGKTGGNWSPREIKATSESGDMVLMSMRAWHKTGKPDKGKDRKNKENWRMYIRIAKDKCDLLAFCKPDKDEDEDISNQS